MKFLSIAAFLLLLCSCCGWGYALTRWTAWNEKYPFAFMAVAGIAFLTFLGGILNLARFAIPVVLDTLLLAGVAFFVFCYWEKRKNWLAARSAASSSGSVSAWGKAIELLPLALLITAAGFYAWTLLPAAAFNISDDFYTYVPRTVRMLQTGTLAGNPYDMLGLDSLGANAFLQGFVLLGFPIQYLLGFDAVFSFALAGLLLLALGRKFGVHWTYSVSAVLAFIVINPQSVNISAIYISAAIMLGLAFASCLLLEQIGESAGDAVPKMAIGILGLLYASLVALKVTFVIYAFVYFSVFFAGWFFIASDRRRILKIGWLTVLAAIVAVSPWLLLHAANYEAAIRLVLHSPTADNGVVLSDGNVAALFSTAALFYGDSFLSYGFIVLGLVLLGCFSLLVVFSGRAGSSHHRYILVAAAACVAGSISYFFNGITFAPENAVRYSCPVLIASFPFAILSASLMFKSRVRSGMPSIQPITLAIVPVLSLLVLVQFWDYFTVRIERAYYQQQTISFALDDDYLAYNRFVFSPESTQMMRAIQYKAQPDQKILAWVSMPMHLDFSRNEIYSVMGPGLLDPWLGMPLSGNVQDMVQYLRHQRIRYIMWEYDGYGMPREEKFREMLSYPYGVYRKIGQRSLYLRKVLEVMMNGGSFLYHANGIVLFDLQQIH